MTTNTPLRTKPLNILCLSEHYLPRTSGTVTYTINICENLAKLGNNVFLITHSPDQNLFTPNKWVEFNGYHVYNVANWGSPNYNTRRSRRYLYKETKKIILGKITETKADIVHVLYGHYLLKIFSHKPIKPPIFWTINNVPPREYSHYQTTPSRIVNEFITKIYFVVVKIVNYVRFKSYKFNKIITPSEYTKQLLLSLGLESDKILTVPNGVDVGLFKPTSPLDHINIKKDFFPLILCVAAIRKHKGLHVLLKAILNIRHLYPQVHLIIIGSIREREYKHELDAYIVNHNMANNCTFVTNKITNDDLCNYYNECDIYIQPSLEEGFCLSILEAASCGKPIVGTNTGAIPEIMKAVSQNNLCPPGDNKCLATKTMQTIKGTINNPHNTSNQHNKIVDQYSWPTTTLKLLSCYRDELRKLGPNTHLSNNKH